MMTVFLLFVVQLFAICHACEKNKKEKILVVTREVADLRLANGFLTDDNDHWKRQNDKLTLAFRSELYAGNIRIENLEKEIIILRKRLFPEPDQHMRDHYECSICLVDFKNSDSFCLADNKHRVVCEQLHVFHAHCLDDLLSSRNFRCPLCCTKYTKIVMYQNPFTANKQDSESFGKKYKDLFDKNDVNSRKKLITAINPYVTAPKDRDRVDEINRIMPQKEFTISEFQNFTRFLEEICETDDRNMKKIPYFDKNLPESKIIDYLQKEMYKESQRSNEYKMIVETLQREEQRMKLMTAEIEKGLKRANREVAGLTQDLAESKEMILTQKKETQKSNSITIEMENGLNRANREVADLRLDNKLLTQKVKDDILVHEDAERVRTENFRLTQDLAKSKVIIETLQREEEKRVQNEAGKDTRNAVREFSIYLPIAVLLFLFPFAIDKLFATNYVAHFEKIQIFEAVVGTTMLATGMLLYTAIGKPAIRAVCKLIKRYW